MKQLLGDNQFFGINHYDLAKGEKNKNQFNSSESISKFITDVITIGLDGFMINSKKLGYEVINQINISQDKEIHYSIPYPNKFASLVNEQGMLSLINYLLKNGTAKNLFVKMPMFITTRKIKHILPLLVDLEIPAKLPKGSYVYLQNLVTDFAFGLKRFDLIHEYCRVILRKGYKPGLITLNPVLAAESIQSLPASIRCEIVICFNLNSSGFNVFPTLESVEKFAKTSHEFKKMAMSILSSGGAKSIDNSLSYIRDLPLDYVVYGSSKLKNIEYNYHKLRNLKLKKIHEYSTHSQR